MEKLRVMGVLMLCFMMSFTSCNAGEADDEHVDYENGIEGLTVRNFPVIDGSDSTEPLRRILMCKLLGFDYEWARRPFTQDPEADIKQVYPEYVCTEEEQLCLRTERMLNSNTHQSFINLIDGKVELILTARSISRDEKAYAEEQGVALIEKPIAKDALAFMVNPENPVNDLAVRQIQGIYTGNIINWNEVGGEDAPITPYVRNKNSGSQEKFETMVMDGLAIKDFPEMQVGQVMMSPYYQLEDDKTGIAFTPFYYYNVIVDNGSTKTIGVDCVAMTKANIMNGTCPYVTDVYAAVRSDIDQSSMAYKIFEFLTTTGGQAIVEESGYVPLSTVMTVNSVKVMDCNIYCVGGNLYVESSSAPRKIIFIGIDGKRIMERDMNGYCIALPTGLASGAYLVKVLFEDGESSSVKIRL